MANTAKCTRTSQLMTNIKKGIYINMQRFAYYGSVVEDSIQAQQRQADRRLLEIQAQRALRKTKKAV